MKVILAASERGNAVNSTVGFAALDHECPVICLGAAVYDVVGLTDQGE